MDCGLDVSEFTPSSRYYIHFRKNTFEKGINPLILTAWDQIKSLLFIYKDGFGIKKPTKVDMLLNTETSVGFYFLLIRGSFNK